MKLSYLVKGLPGHPLHPPLTDAAIGGYTVATALAVLSVLGVSEGNTATAWWLALVLAQIVSAFAAVTGFIDWLDIARGTPLWRTATLHFASMVVAAALFGLTLITGHEGYTDGEVATGPFVLNVIAFGMLTLGGWLGGSVVFVHGMRVLSLVEEPTARAISQRRTRRKSWQRGARPKPGRGTSRSRPWAGRRSPPRPARRP